MVNGTFTATTAATTGWTFAPTSTGYTIIKPNILPAPRWHKTLDDLVSAAQDLRAAFWEYEEAWQ